MDWGISYEQNDVNREYDEAMHQRQYTLQTGLTIKPFYGEEPLALYVVNHRAASELIETVARAMISCLSRQNQSGIDWQTF